MGDDKFSVHMGYRKVACLLQNDFGVLGPLRIRLKKGLSVVFLVGKPPTINSQKNRTSTDTNGRNHCHVNLSREIFGRERTRKHVVPQIDTRITIRSFEAWIHGSF